jgi:hypothetical protein
VEFINTVQPSKHNHVLNAEIEHYERNKHKNTGPGLQKYIDPKSLYMDEFDQTSRRGISPKVLEQQDSPEATKY